jgi:hypothetical protein
MTASEYSTHFKRGARAAMHWHADHVAYIITGGKLEPDKQFCGLYIWTSQDPNPNRFKSLRTQHFSPLPLKSTVIPSRKSRIKPSVP